MEIFVFHFCYHSKTFQERPTTSRWHLSLPVQEWLKRIEKFFISSFFSGKCPSTGTWRQETFFRLGQASTQGSQMKYLRQVISTTKNAKTPMQPNSGSEWPGERRSPPLRGSTQQLTPPHQLHRRLLARLSEPSSPRWVPGIFIWTSISGTIHDILMMMSCVTLFGTKY